MLFCARFEISNHFNRIWLDTGLICLEKSTFGRKTTTGILWDLVICSTLHLPNVTLLIYDVANQTFISYSHLKINTVFTKIGARLKWELSCCLDIYPKYDDKQFFSVWQLFRWWNKSTWTKMFMQQIRNFLEFSGGPRLFRFSAEPEKYPIKLTEKTVEVNCAVPNLKIHRTGCPLSFFQKC